MPLTTEQLDNWFTFHPPTDETRPKYEQLRQLEKDTYIRVGESCIRPNIPQQAAHDAVNAATRAFAEAIDALAPDCADKSAAIRCVRLARMAANEYIAGRPAGAPGLTLEAGVGRGTTLGWGHYLREARWQASAAIACGGR